MSIVKPKEEVGRGTFKARGIVDAFLADENIIVPGEEREKRLLLLRFWDFLDGHSMGVYTQFVDAG